MWEMTGTLYGRQRTLRWDGGLVDWPLPVTIRARHEAASGMTVRYTATGPFVPLNLDDEPTVFLWLASKGMTPTGTPPVFDLESDAPPGARF
jgi:hypothetical protein